MKKTLQIAAINNFKQQTYQTENFKIFTLQKLTHRKESLRIYIEGDGHAFSASGWPSTDPTPTSYFLINLITKDDFPNVIYIARPCQYFLENSCEEKFWTNARFSEEIVKALDAVLQEFSDQKIQLIGYSGGGAVAQLLALRNKNIISIRTIAGNLDHAKFSEIHHVKTLDESLQINNANDLEILQNIPQIHFVGGSDKIIPPLIAQNYYEKLSKKDCTRIVEIKNATHNKGWQERWKMLLNIEPICLQ